MRPNNEKLAKVVKKAISNANKKEIERLLTNLVDSIHISKTKVSDVLQFLKDNGYSTDYYIDLFNKLDDIYEDVFNQIENSSNIPNKTQKEWDLSKGFGK